MGFLARLPREFWYSLAAALAVYLAYSWAWDRGRDSERARLMPQLTQCIANVQTLKDGIANQNDAIEQMRTDQRAALAAGKKAAQAGAKVSARVAPLRPALDAVAATVEGEKVPDAVVNVWDAL